MNTLVVNCGSSSLKSRVYDADLTVVATGSVESIGRPEARLRWNSGARGFEQSFVGATHAHAFDALCEAMIPDVEIGAVGHRVVHGGERFREAAEIDDGVEREIDALTPLAPLHNPLCLVGIRTARMRFPAARHVAVFDTAFHQTLPEEAFLYALPYAYYDRDRVRRYGFHGSSHRSVSRRAIQRLGLEGAPSRVITCHLGAGCSTAAVRDGRSIDTSMGMTPLEGLVMATRSGDVDPGVLAWLARERCMEIDELEDVLQNASGLLGVSGISADMRVLERSAGSGDVRAERALAVFAHRVRKYLGAHLATLGGANAIVMTGGAGENSPALRSRIFRDMQGLGIELDAVENAACAGTEARISTPSSRVAIYVIPSNEEFEIARETQALLALP